MSSFLWFQAGVGCQNRRHSTDPDGHSVMTSHRVAYPSLLLLLHAVISTISPFVPLSQATESDINANSTDTTVTAMGFDIDKTTFFKEEEISSSLLEEDAESDTYLTINTNTTSDKNHNMESQFNLMRKNSYHNDITDENVSNNSTISFTTKSLFSRRQSVCSKCFKFHEFHTNRKSSPREFRSSLMRRTLTNKSDLSVSGDRVGEINNGTSDRVVTILGLFELSTGNSERPEGKSELQAALMAVRDVNEANVLEGYRFHLLTNDTKVRNLILNVML